MKDYRIAIKTFLVISLLITNPIMHLSQSVTEKMQVNVMNYKINRAHKKISIDADWEKEVWRNTEEGALEYFMGASPNHFPKVNFKMLYDDEAVYVIFKVVDKFVKAVAQKHQDKVFQDSCVEFFFSPDSTTSKGYFNLETNCGGTILFNYQTGKNIGKQKIAESDIEKITIASSLPKIIDEEITTDTTWYLEYKLPYSILRNYFEFDKPREKLLWRANFYKCADKTSRPHWLTWNKIDLPKPDFHQPGFFGYIEFQ